MTARSQARPDGSPLTDTELAETLRKRIDGYVTALMVDASAVHGCEKALDEALDALLAEVRRSREREQAYEAALSQIENITPTGSAAYEIARDVLAASSAAPQETT